MSHRTIRHMDDHAKQELLVALKRIRIWIRGDQPTAALAEIDTLLEEVEKA